MKNGKWRRRSENVKGGGGGWEGEDGLYNKVTDSAGRYEFGQITAGVHSFVIKEDGYVDVPINVDLATGVTKHLSIMVMKIIQ